MRKGGLQSPFEFTWTVPVLGFKWTRATQLKTKTEDTFLIDRLVIPPYRRLLYSPLRDCSGLFRTFSQVKPTRPGILKFANEYGQLGDPCRQDVIVLRGSKLPGGGQHGSFAKGELLKAWVKEILYMRALVCLWDAARRAETSTLTKWIHWHDGQISYDLQVDKFRAAGTLAAPDYHPELLDRFAAADIVQPAWYLLQRELNNRLKEHPALPGLGWDLGQSELGVHLTPTSLISALWVQFAFAVGENHSYRTCAACGKWFQVGPGGDMRADAKYCSNACRQRKYRERPSK
jgi:hypothetical protein